MVGKDKIEITAELKDLLTGQLKNIQNEAAKLDNTLKNLGDGGAIGKSGSNSGGFGKSLTGSVVAANLLTGAIGFAKNAVVDFATSGFESLQKFENYEARLSTLLGDRTQAQLAMNKIVNDAAKTPFDVGSLVEANSALIGAGENATNARKMIMDLGNAISATGGGSDELKRMSVNLNQIRSIGKASALDIKQFVYAGIPIYKLLNDTIGKNKELVEKQGVTYQDLAKVFAKAREEGGMFYKGLENGSETLSGKVSNLEDSWEQLKVSILQSQKGILASTIDWATGMVSQLNRVAKNENQVQNSFDKYGAKDYSTLQKLAPGQLLAGLFGKSKVQEDTKYQDALNKNYVEKAGMSQASAAQSMAQLAQLIANNSTFTAIKEQGKFENAQNIAILKGTLAEVTKIFNDFKTKPKGSEDGSGGIIGNDKQVSSLEKVAAANKPTQVNINIENLVREYKNTFNSASEALKMTPEQVAKVLISAVNDITNLKYS